MPIRDWIAIRKSLVANYNPKVAAKFGDTPTNDEQTIINQMQIKSTDSNLIAQTRITLFNNQFPVQSYAAVPEWWQIRIEAGRPQLIFMFAQKLGEDNFDSAKYPLTIPHPIVKHYQTSPIPDYQKGQWEALLTLKDNSKLIINAISAEEAQRVLDACKLIIQPEFLQGALQRPIAPRKGPELLEINVSARRAEYFSTGLKNTVPDWIDSFT